MPPLSIVAAQLVRAPKPVLCLDACDILEILECLGWEKPPTPRQVACIGPAKRLLDTLVAYPDRVQLVITELVALEVNQNLPAIRANAQKHLTTIDDIIGMTHQAAASANTAIPTSPVFSKSMLAPDLEAMSMALLNQAIQLDRDQSCVNRAVERVVQKKRPSHDGHLKDSMHFEHYLELARQLRTGGFKMDCIFVSKNKKDYGDPIHADLASEINDPSVNVRFYGTLGAALGFLRI